MPSVLIEVRRQYTPEQEIGIMDAVYSCLQEAFDAKIEGRFVRLVVHAPHRFAGPPQREQPEYLTHIGIDAFVGRTLDAKRLLYRLIVAKLEPFGIPADHVKIVVHDTPKENAGIRGGKAACDV